YFAPDVVGEIVLLVFILQDVHAFLDPVVIIGNALARIALHRFPVALLEMAARVLARFAEHPVMLVESVQDRARDIERDLRRQQLREGGLHRAERLQPASAPPGAASRRSSASPLRSTASGSSVALRRSLSR